MVTRAGLWLLAAPAGLAVLDWLSLTWGWQKIGYLAKPGVILALAAWAIATPPGALTQIPAVLFITGLIFSAFGDIFLMLPQERFIAGLGSFLLAHLAYTGALISRGLPAGPLPLFAAGGALMSAIFMMRRLRTALFQKKLNKLWTPIVIYTLVITLMLLASTQTLSNQNWSRASAAFIGAGAVLFYLSDAALAWNRFIARIARGQLIVRILYQTGQLMLTAGFYYDFLPGG